MKTRANAYYRIRAITRIKERPRLQRGLSNVRIILVYTQMFTVNRE